jgi:transposase
MLPIIRRQEVKDFIEKHHQQIRLFFLPPHSPELNPDEQVWNEIKHRKLEKQPIKNRKDFKTRVDSALKELKECKEKVKSFFQLKDTIAAINWIQYDIKIYLFLK